MKSSSIVASCLAGIALMSNQVNGETMTAEELEAHKNTFIQIDVRGNTTVKADCAVAVDPFTADMTAYQFKQATYNKAKMDTAIYISGTEDGTDHQVNADYLMGLGFTNVVNLGGYGGYMHHINNNCNRNTWSKSPVCEYYHFDTRSAEEVAEQGALECAYGINGTELLTMSGQNITDEFMIDPNFPIRVSCHTSAGAQPVVDHLLAEGFANATNAGGWGYWNNASSYNFEDRFALIGGCQDCAQRKYTPSDPESKLNGGFGYSMGKGGKGGNKGGKGGKGANGAKGAKGSKGANGAKGAWRVAKGATNGEKGAKGVANGEKGAKGATKGAKGGHGKTGKLSAFLASDHANVAGGVLSGAVLVAGVAAFAIRRRNAKRANYEEITPLLANQIPDSVQIAVTV